MNEVEVGPAWMRALAGALNRLLALDPDAGRILAEIAPCQVGLRITGLSQPLLITVLAGEVDVRPWPSDLIVDVEVSGPPASLLALLVNDADAAALRGGAVEIRGDAQAGDALRRALARLDFDFEEWLAGHIGDVMAHQLGNAARGLGAWLRRAASHFEQDVGEYLTTETAQVADARAVRQFMVAVDDVRDDVERLEHRIARLGRVRPKGGS